MLAYAGRYTELKSSDGGKGRWYAGKCPLHDDTHPSFWVDAEHGLWGCRSCGIRGDVLNLHAHIRKISLQSAIRELADEMTTGQR
jgi:DNA primase